MMSTVSLGRAVASLPRKFGRVLARKEFSALVPIEDEFPGYVPLNLDGWVAVVGGIDYPGSLLILRLFLKAAYLDSPTIEGNVDLRFNPPKWPYGDNRRRRYQLHSHVNLPQGRLGQRNDS